MTAVAAEAAVVVDNGRETSGETSLWHGAAAGAAARVDPLLYIHAGGSPYMDDESQRLGLLPLPIRKTQLTYDQAPPHCYMWHI